MIWLPSLPHDFRNRTDYQAGIVRAFIKLSSAFKPGIGILLLMMLFLVLNIGYRDRFLLFTQRESAIPPLPGKMIIELNYLIEVVSAGPFQRLEYISERMFGRNSHNHMQVVVTAIDGINIYAQFSRLVG